MRNDDDNDLSLARFCSGCLAQSLRPGVHRGWRSREVTISETESTTWRFGHDRRYPSMSLDRWIMHLLRASRRSLSVPLLRTSSGITIGSSGILDGFVSRDIIGGNAVVWKSMIERRRICKKRNSKLSIIMLMHASFYLFTIDIQTFRCVCYTITVHIYTIKVEIISSYSTNAIIYFNSIICKRHMSLLLTLLFLAEENYRSENTHFSWVKFSLDRFN